MNLEFGTHLYIEVPVSAIGTENFRGHGGSKMAKYISDVIKTDYENWSQNQVVFISAPTGSGKTTFVLKNLIEYAVSKQQKILYLVNRTILKEHIQKKINLDVMRKLRSKKLIDLNDSVNNIIEVELYQTIELKCKDNPQYLNDTNSKYDYIIADECHYFFADSTFNTYTQLSYDWIINKKNSILIFMSATIDRIEKKIRMDICHEIEGEKETETRFSMYYENDPDKNYDIKRTAKKYDAEGDYSYLNWNLLEKIEDIIEDIIGLGGKWLIFVDSIKKGKEIDRLLNDSGIVSKFIDAKSRNCDELSETVNSIVKLEKFEQQVVVATSVMDNGISIKDMELRNIIIMADVPEEFIQMLGRKRRFSDSEKLDVYILRRTQGEFEKRRKEVENHIEFIEHFLQHRERILESIMRYRLSYEYARDTCFVKQGKLELNQLAAEQFDYLLEHYEKIINRFENDGGNAFILEQMEWLKVENAEELSRSLTMSLKEKICEVLDKYINKDLTVEEKIEMRELIRWDLKKCLESCAKRNEEEVRRHIKDMGKKSNAEKTFSDKRFNAIMEVLEFEYRMKKSKSQLYIEKISPEQNS